MSIGNEVDRGRSNKMKRKPDIVEQAFNKFFPDVKFVTVKLENTPQVRAYNKALKKTSKLTPKQLVHKYLSRKGKNVRSKTIAKLDKLFSDYMKEKAESMCFKCHKVKSNMGVSHHFSRTYIGTKWTVANCDWAGWDCHQIIEKDKKGWYKSYMIKKLGKEGFDMLEIKAHTITKIATVDLQALVNNFDKIWK